MKHILIIILSAFFSVNVVIADTEKTEDQAEFFLRHLANTKFIKSGTPVLLRLLQGNSDDAIAFRTAYTTRDRPEMETFADSEKGHFRVHYDISGKNAPDSTDNDMNGVPDFADSALVYLEHAWQLIVVELGYGQPKFDGTKGGLNDLNKPLIDCYLKEMAPQRLYGITSPDGVSGGPVSSYITIDNDFSEIVFPTKGYDALKITTAHEFFHVIHYTYYGGYDAVWWMEQTAVWLEYRAWNDVNDYLNYVGFIYSDRDLPIDTYNGSFEYGATLFAFHIAQKYGENTIRSIWNSFRDNQNGRIENLNTVLPEGIAGAISDLAVWMYFTGNRANTEDFFTEAGLITDTISPEQIITDKTTLDSLSFRHYTFKYVDISPEKGFSYGDSLYFEFDNRNEGLWKNQVILYRSPINYEVIQLSGTKPSLFIPRPFYKAVLVITNTTEQNKTYNYVYNIEIVSTKGIEDEPAPVPFALHQNFPNPFNSSTTITYSINEKSHITLKIMNIQGAAVATLVDDLLYPGSYRETFYGTNLSSGVYFVILESKSMIMTKKISLVK